MEKSPMVPAEIPSHRMVCFGVDDVDAACATTLEAGSRRMPASQDGPNGRCAIVGAPRGAIFGVHLLWQGRP
jgi:predicted enzyme related to lactoylglutathione lyase